MGQWCKEQRTETKKDGEEVGRNEDKRASVNKGKDKSKDAGIG